MRRSLDAEDLGGRSRRRSTRLGAVATALILCAAPIAPAGAGGACGKTSVGFKPLNELGAGKYKGEQGGLYPGGVNKRPPSHTKVGLSLAKSHAVPRRADGTPDLKKGKLVFLSIGVSNTSAEFNTFIGDAKNDPLKSSRVVPVNGAVGGVEAHEVAEGSRYFPIVEERLAKAGVTPEQVGAVWMKEADGKPYLPFPEDAQTLEEDLVRIVQKLKKRFPNLWLVYVSSRVYAGYAVSDVNPEPWAYQSGFSAKWLIERQLTGSLPIGEDTVPWLSWGPYMWADGTHTRSDGLKWLCDDFKSDGTHTGRSGTAKVSNILLKFLHTDPTAKIWYQGGSQTPGASSLPNGSPGPSASPTIPNGSVSPGASTEPTAPGGTPLARSSGADDGSPWTALLLALGPVIALVAYRLLRGKGLLPRRADKS
jgi:hypothetical protein